MEAMEMKSFWHGKHVFLTGNTGFKGAWLNLWLEKSGAFVSSLALPPEEDVSLYSQLFPSKPASHHTIDLCDATRVKACLLEAQPEIVIHMAAQALVRRSYEDPIATYATNVMGTVNLLDAVRACDSVKTVLVVTSDKVYANDDYGRPFVETDTLGGKDPYSNSKAVTEIVCQGYRASFLAKRGVRLVCARAGNVIGGGDWSVDRLVPDVMRAFEQGEPVSLRYPHAVRPWQHVLEPIAGYMRYIEQLAQTPENVPEALNFGPDPESATPVVKLVEALSSVYKPERVWEQAPGEHPPEAQLLKLNSDLAQATIGWRSRLDLSQTLDWTSDWYAAMRSGEDMRAFTLNQIAAYEEILA